MATHAIPVTEKEKDEEGVQAVQVNIPGVGRVTTYYRVVTTDDVDEKTTKDVASYTFSLPVEEEEEHVDLDAEGHEILNEDGSQKIRVEKVWKTISFDVDLSPASRAKLVKALEPFTKNARQLESVPTPVSSNESNEVSASTVRRWAQANNILVDEKPVNPMGRVSQGFIEAYNKAHA